MTTNIDIDFWQDKIHYEIPATRLLKLSITELKEGSIFMQAPLAENINGHGTGFAGSLFTLSITTGWTLLNHLLRKKQIESSVVAGNASIKYMAPAQGDLFSSAKLNIDEDSLTLWRQKWKMNKAARQVIKVRIESNQIICAEFEAEFFIKPPTLLK